jgi:adenosylcobinamide-GDP ribazoletransferase
MSYWPMIGALLGLASGSVYALVSLGFPAVTAAILAVAVVPIVTGCFHEDGFADVCDAFGGYSPEQRRTILKDSRVGSFATVGVVLLLSAMVSVLASLEPSVAVATLIGAHAWSRWTAPFATWAMPGVADASSLAKPLATHVSPKIVLCATLWAGVASIPLGWAGGLAAATCAIVVSLAAGMWLRKWLGGLTGDGLGAINMIVQLGVLMAAPKAVAWSQEFLR